MQQHSAGAERERVTFNDEMSVLAIFRLGAIKERAANGSESTISD
jgi:hypothetical protein